MTFFTEASSRTASKIARTAPDMTPVRGSTGRTHQWSWLGPTGPRRRTLRTDVPGRLRRCRRGGCGTQSCGQAPRGRRARCCARSPDVGSRARQQDPLLPPVQVGRLEGVLRQQLALEERKALVHQVEGGGVVDRVVGQDPVDEGRQREAGQDQQPEKPISYLRMIVTFSDWEATSSSRLRNRGSVWTRRR